MGQDFINRFISASINYDRPISLHVQHDNKIVTFVSVDYITNLMVA